MNHVPVAVGYHTLTHNLHFGRDFVAGFNTALKLMCYVKCHFLSSKKVRGNHR